MPSQQEKNRPAFRAPAQALSFLAATLAASMLFGCLPAPKAKVTEAPVVVTEAPDPKTAYWKNEYRKNRMEPPRDFQVPPKPAPNNQFGEFEDAMFAGLDSQPRLPTLPDDPHIMPAVGGPASYPAPASSYPLPPQRSRAEAAAYPVTASAAAGAASTAAARPRPAGIATDAHFYPIEQLVYGGDYPDIDKAELYRLMPKDTVSITVKDHPEFSGKLTIQPDGTVRVPNTPDMIRIRGMTVEEAAEEVRRHLAVYVKGECLVRLQANRARGGYYFVFGDVLQPGRFLMGMEPVKLSDAVLAANWEANPARLDADGDELGPAFPAASPRGKFIAPRSADLARVMLITPHRSQPARTVHDVRSAMLGVTANDPAVRPGQIIVVPSLNPERNRSLGLDIPDMPAVPEARMGGAGFSGANTPARLPEVLPPASPYEAREAYPVPEVESNMAAAFETQSTTGPLDVEGPGGEFCETVVREEVVYPSTVVTRYEASGSGTPVGRRLGRKLPQKRQFSEPGQVEGWNKGL